MHVGAPHTGEAAESHQQADETAVESAPSDATPRSETRHEHPTVDRCQLPVSAADEPRSSGEGHRRLEPGPGTRGRPDSPVRKRKDGQGTALWP
jgi:hypothetical protein